jgi:hypothetical protein
MANAEKKKLSKGQIVLMAVGAFVLLGIIGNLMGGGKPDPVSSTSSDSQIPTDRNFPTKLISSEVSNPSDLSVTFSVKNDSSGSITPDCTIEATDPSGTYVGVYEDTQAAIPAGVTQTLIAQVSIEQQGAAYITDLKATCTAVTSDTSSSTGKEVKVKGVSECGGNDGTTWYWAPCFSADVAPKTQMTCAVKALDASGKTLASMTYQANTLNDGSVIGYGENQGTQNVSKSIYKSIKSLTVSCHL